MCQSAGMAPPGFEKQKKDPPNVLLSQKEFSKAPAWHISMDGLLKMTVPPVMGQSQMPNAPADPEMVVHPPQSSIGVQPPGTQVAQNLYPDLQLMRIDQSKMKAEPIPTAFPNMKMEKTPTTWAQHKVLPVQSGKADTAAK